MPELIGKVILQNVRLSYPHLHKPQTQKQDNGTETQKYSAGFLISKAKLSTLIGIHQGKRLPIMEAIKAASNEARAKVWGDNPEKWPKLPPDRLFIRDGDLFKADKAEYVGHHFINSSASVEDKPAVLTNRRDGNNNWIPAQPGQPGDCYGGCYVNAILAIWAQDNRYGRRLNAQTKAVQFFADGEAFGGGSVNVNEDFTDDLAGTTGSVGDVGEVGSDDSDLI